MRLFEKLHWERLLEAADLLVSEQETDICAVFVRERGDSWKPFVRTSRGPPEEPNPELVLLCPALCRPSQASFMWKSFEIFSMCCLIAPLFDPSCTPYVHALTLKGLPQANVSLLLPVTVLTVTVSHPPGLLAERAALCGQRPRCLSRPPVNGFVLSIPPNVTHGRVYSKWCIRYMKTLCGRISRLWFF